MGFFESLQSKQKEEGPRIPIVSSFYTAPQAIAAEKPYYALVQAYKSWVYTAIDKIAKSVAMVPLNLYIYRNLSTGKKTTNLQWRAEYKSIETERERKYFLKEMGLKKEQIFDHPFLTLIHHPNSLMTRFMLWYETMVRLELGGLCGWLQVKNKIGIPSEIWPLPLTQFAMLRPKVTPSLRLQYWDYQDGSVNQRFEPDEILLYKYPHPASPFQAMSPLMAQTYPYDIDLFLMQQQRALYKNMGIPGITLETDAELGKEQFREIREQLIEEYGSAMQAGVPMILHSGLRQGKAMAMTGRESLLNDVQQFVREKLITAYDLSPSKIGLHEKDNRATAEVMDQTFINECLKPKCMLIEEVIETFALPQYDEGITCDFDLPSYPDREFLLKERETNLRIGYHTINKELEINGEPPVPWGDKPWLPFGLMQPGGESPQPPAGKEAKFLKLMNRSFWTEERKDVYWKLFVKRVDNYQHLIEMPMREYFSAMKEDVINRLHKDGGKILAYFSGWSRQKVQHAVKDHKGIRDINVSKAEEKKNLVKMVEPIVKNIMQEVGKHRMKDILETMKAVNPTFDVNAPGAIKWLGSRMRQFSEQVSGTTFDEIERILKEGFAAESPVTEIAETLRQKFDSWEEYRASMIARTETLAAMNQADIEGVRQTGLEDELLKHWLSARDEHVRPTHQRADEEYADGIQMDELFKVGNDEMDAPLEGTDPAESINCRCTLYYSEKGEGGKVQAILLRQNKIEQKRRTEEEARKGEEARKREEAHDQRDAERIKPIVWKLDELGKGLGLIEDRVFVSLQSATEVLKSKIESDERISLRPDPPVAPIEIKIEPIPIDLNLTLKENQSKKKKLTVKRGEDGKMVSAEIE